MTSRAPGGGAGVVCTDAGILRAGTVFSPLFSDGTQHEECTERNILQGSWYSKSWILGSDVVSG